VLGNSAPASVLTTPNGDFLTTDLTGRSDTTWIYFLSIDNGRAIKIGHSRQVRGKRITQHSKSHLGHTVVIEPLCEVRGTVSDEGSIHRYFNQFVLPGECEVFTPASEIVDYIRWLRDRWWVVTPDTSNTEREAMPAVSFSDWMPSPDRRKPRQTRIPGIGDDLLPGFRGALSLPGGPLDIGEREITGDDFYTNEVIIRAARKLMGRIDVDPASHAIANRVVQAGTFYTISDNGLTKHWGGKVWINPPFSAWSSWVPKILSEWDSGRIDEMCVLSAMRTVTAQYFNPLLEACKATCIIKGRIKFWGGKAGDSPDDGHCIFYFGKNRELFKECFSELGAVFYGANK
jgi:hypothetical protein